MNVNRRSMLGVVGALAASTAIPSAAEDRQIADELKYDRSVLPPSWDESVIGDLTAIANGCLRGDAALAVFRRSKKMAADISAFIAQTYSAMGNIGATMLYGDAKQPLGGEFDPDDQPFCDTSIGKKYVIMVASEELNALLRELDKCYRDSVYASRKLEVVSIAAADLVGARYAAMAAVDYGAGMNSLNSREVSRLRKQLGNIMEHPESI